MAAVVPVAAITVVGLVEGAREAAIMAAASLVEDAPAAASLVEDAPAAVAIMAAAITEEPGTEPAAGTAAAITGAAGGIGGRSLLGALAARSQRARPSASSAPRLRRPGPARRPATAIVGIIPTVATQGFWDVCP